MSHTWQCEREAGHWKLSVLVPLLGTQSLEGKRAEKGQSKEIQGKTRKKHTPKQKHN